MTALIGALSVGANRIKAGGGFPLRLARNPRAGTVNSISDSCRSVGCEARNDCDPLLCPTPRIEALRAPLLAPGLEGYPSL
jgi:hypothetical protein